MSTMVNIIKNKIYGTTVGTVSKFNRKVVEKGKIHTPKA